MSETYWYPTWLPFTYTLVPAYPNFALAGLPGGKQSNDADGVIELH